MIPDDLWARRVRVEPHAVERVRARLGWGDEERVAGEVRLAILEERVSEKRPEWTNRSGRRRGDQRHRNRIYVWPATYDRCWVVAVDAGGAYLFVVTVLLDGEDIPDLRLRAGTVRA